MSHGHHNKAHALSAAGQRHSWVDATAPASDSDGSEGYEDPAVESDTESEPYDEAEDAGPGWVEGLTSLKEGEGATALLDGHQLAAEETQVPPTKAVVERVPCHMAISPAPASRQTLCAGISCASWLRPSGNDRNYHHT